jgi:hypothetical protein
MFDAVADEYTPVCVVAAAVEPAWRVSLAVLDDEGDALSDTVFLIPLAASRAAADVAAVSLTFPWAAGATVSVARAEFETGGALVRMDSSRSMSS